MTNPNFFEFAFGRVYYRFKPTAYDKVGCEGIYISKVVLSRAYTDAVKRAVASLQGKIVKFGNRKTATR